MLIEQFLKYLQYEKNYSTHTVFAYNRDLNQFFIFIDNGISNPSNVDGADVRLWMSSLMDQGLSAKTINRKLSSLKSFYKYLLRMGIVDQNPMSYIEGPKLSQRLPSFIKETELNTLLNDVDFGEGFEALRDKAIVETFYGTGMRLSELMNLTHQGVDLSSRVVKVTGKRNKQRIIPINTSLYITFQTYIQQKKAEGLKLNGVFFVTIKGKALYEKLIYRTVRKYLNMVTSQSKRSPHVLRHSFATSLLNRGAEINSVKELLGHANLSATEVYTHNTFEELKKSYNKAHPRA